MHRDRMRLAIGEGEEKRDRFGYVIGGERAAFHKN